MNFSKVIVNYFASSCRYGHCNGTSTTTLNVFLVIQGFEKENEIALRMKFFKRNGDLLLQQQTYAGAVGTPKVFSAKELEVATENFNERLVLGRGLQGTVYKRMLYGKIVAIKKSKLVEVAQVGQFINEIVILSQINHINVVKLLGCCLETGVPLLVYEYIPNGTLSELIHDHDHSYEFQLSWSMRLKMAVDVASALAYMHSASSKPIPVKSTN